jgi:hypothetical protein
MPRRKRQAVEGITLDLTSVEDGDVDITALIVEVEKKAEVKPHVKKTVTDEELLNRIRCKCYCDECKKPIFTPVRPWRGAKLCYNCHATTEKDISPELTAYIKDIYSRGCVFCGIKQGKFHLDHINMFTKVNSVGSMMDMGESAEVIIAEVAKCQLLCVNCHALVTAFERKRDFLKKKASLNRKIASGADVTELRRQLYDEYEAVMTKMYPLIREKATNKCDENTIQHVEESDSESSDSDSVAS